MPEPVKLKDVIIPKYELPRPLLPLLCVCTFCVCVVGAAFISGEYGK
jgi:hypothetical protein